ncbi:unnamed protein product, partial [Pylaiella littoralis]
MQHFFGYIRTHSQNTYCRYAPFDQSQAPTMRWGTQARRYSSTRRRRRSMGSVGRDTRTIFHERAHSKAPRTPRIRRYINLYLARTIPNNTK